METIARNALSRMLRLYGAALCYGTDAIGARYRRILARWPNA